MEYPDWVPSIMVLLHCIESAQKDYDRWKKMPEGVVMEALLFSNDLKDVWLEARQRYGSLYGLNFYMDCEKAFCWPECEQINSEQHGKQVDNIVGAIEGLKKSLKDSGFHSDIRISGLLPDLGVSSLEAAISCNEIAYSNEDFLNDIDLLSKGRTVQNKTAARAIAEAINAPLVDGLDQLLESVALSKMQSFLIERKSKRFHLNYFCRSLAPTLNLHCFSDVTMTLKTLSQAFFKEEIFTKEISDALKNQPINGG